MDFFFVLHRLEAIGFAIALLCSSGESRQADVDNDVNSTSTLDTNFRCADLLLGQYICHDPEIDPDTQQARGCDPVTRTVQVTCTPAPQIVCDGIQHNGTTTVFHKTVPCKWTNGCSFETALLLSIFLGMFGIDRFYLGYPAIGLLKFSTLGFFFLGQLIDVLLIASQVVKPADGSDYVIDYYGAGLIKLMWNSETVVSPPEQ